MTILERSLFKKIDKLLSKEDIIVIHGARQVGKTSLLKYIQLELTNRKKHNLYIDLEDLRFVQLINSGVDNFLKYLKEQNFLGKSRLYVLIDEIQYLADPSNFLKLVRDHHSEIIKLIVSGSSSFEIKSKFKNSLAGRTINFELYPLNFEEFLSFKGISIDIKQENISSVSIEQLKNLYEEYVIFGGYPRVVLEKKISDKEMYLQQVIDTYIRKDIRDLYTIKDILKFNKLLEVLASQSGSLLNIIEIANTTKLARQTVENYLFLMENTYILKMLPPFSSRIRSELFKTPKVFFYDTGIMNLLWLKTFPKVILGNMFETAVFSDIIKLRSSRDLFYWRTQDKKEVDFILRKQRKLLPIEVKISTDNLNSTSLSYFTKNYKLKKSFCVGLQLGKKRIRDVNYIYPWDLIRLLA